MPNIKERMTVSGSVTKSGLEKVISGGTKGGKVTVGEGSCFAVHRSAGEADPKEWVMTCVSQAVICRVSRELVHGNLLPSAFVF